MLKIQILFEFLFLLLVTLWLAILVGKHIHGTMFYNSQKKVGENVHERKFDEKLMKKLYYEQH